MAQFILWTTYAVFLYFAGRYIISGETDNADDYTFEGRNPEGKA